MPSSSADEKPSRRGVARSIDALFDALEEDTLQEDAVPASPPAPAEEHSDAAAEVDRRPAPPPEPPDEESGAALAEAVEHYLSGEGARRDEMSRRVRELAARLEKTSRHEPVADAAERLVVAGHLEAGQDAPLSLARLLVTPGVATVLTQRLGAARDEERRAQLVAVAAALPDELAPPVADALAATDERSARRACMQALVAMGDGAMEVVADMVDDPRWFVVRNAVLIHGELGGEASIEHLTTTLAHDDPRVRRETLLALAKIGGEDAATLVRHKLDDPDPGARAAAAMAMGELGGERDVRTLVSALDGEGETEVQVALVRALGQIGDPGAVPALEKRAVSGFFSRGVTDVRVAAYRALAAIGTPHARKLLRSAADDRDPAVRRVAREAADG